MIKDTRANYRKIVAYAVLSALVLPSVSFAQTVSTLLTAGINIFKVLIEIFLALAVLVFFWGIVRFIMNIGSAGSDDRSREEGKKVIVWGIIGIFVMVSLWAIVGFIQSSLLGGISAPPTIPVPPGTMPTP